MFAADRGIAAQHERDKNPFYQARQEYNPEQIIPRPSARTDDHDGLAGTDRYRGDDCSRTENSEQPEKFPERPRLGVDTVGLWDFYLIHWAEERRGSALGQLLCVVVTADTTHAVETQIAG